MNNDAIHIEITQDNRLQVSFTDAMGREVIIRTAPGELDTMIKQQVESQTSSLTRQIEALDEKNKKLEDHNSTLLDMMGQQADRLKIMEQQNKLQKQQIKDTGGQPHFQYAINPDLFQDAPTEWAARLWDCLLNIALTQNPDGSHMVRSGAQIAAIYIILRNLKDLKYRLTDNMAWFLSGWKANVVSRISDPKHAAQLTIRHSSLRSAVSRSPLREKPPALWKDAQLSGTPGAQAFAEALMIMKNIQAFR